MQELNIVRELEYIQELNKLREAYSSMGIVIPLLPKLII